MLDLTNIGLIIFDLDGTVRRCKEHSTSSFNAPCHNLKNQWEIIPGTKVVLDMIDWSKIGLGFATNQQQIGLGISTSACVEHEIHFTIQALFPEYPLVYVTHPYIPDIQLYSYHIERARMPKSGNIIRYAPARLDDSDYRSKPSPYMILSLVGDYNERLDRTLFVGDTEKDRRAAQGAGVHFQWAWEFFGRESVDLGDNQFVYDR